MGVSDRHHFGWLRGALERFERETGCLAAIGRAGAPPVLWCLAEHRLHPPLAYLAAALGPRPVEVVRFDKFSHEPGVRVLDLNDLGHLPEGSCDVLTLFRASLFIERPGEFLAHVRRILRPGGIAIIDWLHGLSDAPVLTLDGKPEYGGVAAPFLTTYADQAFLREFPSEFGAFLRHVNRPPVWANVEEPGAPVPLGRRLARLVRGPGRGVTPGSYLGELRKDLATGGKHLIEPALMEEHFKVLYRDARYFYRATKKFNLYLLTVLEPVGT